MTLTLTKTPVQDPTFAIAAPLEQMGDEILLESAAKTKTAKVHGNTRGSRQSAEARAWTSQGKVD